MLKIIGIGMVNELFQRDKHYLYSLLVINEVHSVSTICICT